MMLNCHHLPAGDFVNFGSCILFVYVYVIFVILSNLDFDNEAAPPRCPDMFI